MPVRILLMDIDDTLFDFQTGYKRALRAALAQFGVECTPQLLELYGSINDRLWERFERGEISREEVLIERCTTSASGSCLSAAASTPHPRRATRRITTRSACSTISCRTASRSCGSCTSGIKSAS